VSPSSGRMLRAERERKRDALRSDRGGDCQEGAHWRGGMDVAYGKGRLPGGSPLERWNGCGLWEREIAGREPIGKARMTGSSVRWVWWQPISEVGLRDGVGSSARWVCRGAAAK